ncbi:hypothetical protein RJ640_008572 [Escallonia rubra]|uniref:Uncharacterized protein n=1 Tax=Escallonia rubra TaxID=112253 RepID=A0AA88QJR5_9ASTE|nr:hypothetical protein RJ640_008572 [Escallonia rubra]
MYLDPNLAGHSLLAKCNRHASGRLTLGREGEQRLRGGTSEAGPAAAMAWASWIGGLGGGTLCTVVGGRWEGGREGKFGEAEGGFDAVVRKAGDVKEPSLQELVFIENPALMGSLSGNMSNMTSLRRVVLTGTGVSGKVPDGFGDLVNLEQLTLSRNRFSGEVLLDFSKLKKLKVLDLSQNGFEGNIPESVGGLTGLLKLDLSFNKFSGKITESLKGLRGRK